MPVSSLADQLEDVGAMGFSMYRGWAWATVNLGRRIENRRWQPNERFRGSMFAIHAMINIGDQTPNPIEPHGSVNRGTKELADLTRYANRAGHQARYDPIRRIVIFDVDGEEIPLNVQALTASAIVGFARLDGWAINPADRDLGGWLKLSPEIVKARGWAKPGWVGFHFSEIVRLDRPVLFPGLQKFWSIPREKLEEVEGFSSPATRDALVQLAGMCRRPMFPERVIPFMRMAKPCDDWSGAYRSVVPMPGKTFTCSQQYKCEYCEDRIGAGEPFARLMRKRRRYAHPECAPGIGMPVGDYSGRHGTGSGATVLRLPGSKEKR